MDILLEDFTEMCFSDYFRLVSSVEVMAMITERAIPYDEACHDFEKMLNDNARNAELGCFRIVDANKGNFIGLAKLVQISEKPQTAELGYMLLPEFWGRGIASRVTRLLIEKASKNLEISTLIAIIDPANAASRKILTNHDFVSVEFRDFDGLPGEILQRAI
ncbi:GNAT family N-acetyltransferase [Erwinia rhapontici]|uniref:GNAT family N-acetyltransferase n=1 Tax=Erwinia rhapontici TaxID=55212 RepID=UPI0021677112|nr:GNAT family N-acetyltransferase [Erwinia rhapontici]MCS3607505.1 RimJ/RimL family protein N-acetyltransferase [Erwinia rhapontici]